MMTNILITAAALSDDDLLASLSARISLRCWRHNQYEAELVFGPHRPSIARGDASASPP
jgi:hypothetical protein